MLMAFCLSRLDIYFYIHIFFNIREAVTDANKKKKKNLIKL